jgi:OmpA-OmpF porin, OOP family
MRHLVLVSIAMALVACAGGKRVKSPDRAPDGTQADAAPAGAAATAPAPDAGDPNSFALHKSDTAGDAHGEAASKIAPTLTEAAMRLIVLDRDKAPIEGIVISLVSADGQKYFTDETDATGYAEVLVPVGKKYDLIYLSLGRSDITASVSVADKPRQNIKLTLVYKGKRRAQGDAASRFVLDGVNFDTGKATIRPESFPRLDSVVEYMTYHKRARVEISGHTDNVGNKKDNKILSDKRAKACRAYLISKGIDGGRIDAVGYGDERPVAPNTTEEGRQQNRRIEATEL